MQRLTFAESVNHPVGKAGFEFRRNNNFWDSSMIVALRFRSGAWEHSFCCQAQPSSTETLLDLFDSVPLVDIALRNLERVTGVELFAECLPETGETGTRVVQHLEVHSNSSPAPGANNCGALLHYRFGEIPLYYAASPAPGELSRFIFFQWLWNNLTEQSRAAVAYASVCNRSGRLARMFYRCATGHVTFLEFSEKLSQAAFAEQLRGQCSFCGAEAILCNATARE